MERTSLPRAESLAHIAPPQILKHERSFAVLFALLFFALWSLPLWGALLVPTLLAYIVVLYDLYWTFQALYSSLAALVSYRRLQQWSQIDWCARYRQLGQPVQQVVIIPNLNERPEI